jgi:hypothetical protein
MRDGYHRLVSCLREMGASYPAQIVEAPRFSERPRLILRGFAETY